MESQPPPFENCSVKNESYTVDRHSGAAEYHRVEKTGSQNESSTPCRWILNSSGTVYLLQNTDQMCQNTRAENDDTSNSNISSTSDMKHEQDEQQHMFVIEPEDVDAVGGTMEQQGIYVTDTQQERMAVEMIGADHSVANNKSLTGEKSFQCTVCGKFCAQSDSLIQHMKTHTSETPFTCAICGKTFIDKRDLMAHTSRHTAEQKLQYTDSGKVLSHKATYSQNSKSHTPKKSNMEYRLTAPESSDEDQQSEGNGHLSEINSDTDSDFSDTTSNTSQQDQPSVVIQTDKHTKKHSCVFCGKLYSKVARHLEKVHRNEEDVANVLILPKNSAERRRAFKLLENKGDFAHNQDVRKENNGIILQRYRIGKRGQNDMADYAPCVNCLGTYKRTDLSRHQKTCIAASGKRTRSVRRQCAQDSGQIHVSNSEISDTIPDTSKQDQPSIVLQTDNHTKKHSCIFCGKLYSKVARHLEKVHRDEADVANILILPKNSVERRRAFKLLENKGDFAHNQDVRKENKGIIVAYGMGKRGQKDMADYAPCVDCLGTYKRRDLSRHQKTCIAASGKRVRSVRRQCAQGSGQISKSEISDTIPGTGKHDQPSIVLQTDNHTKKHSCVFCGKLYSKVARHLEKVHRHEKDVAKILILPKNSVERRRAFKLLENKGDFAHNQDVRKENKGIIVAYGMGKRGQKDMADYVPCLDCLGTYKNSELLRHQKICIAASEKREHAQSNGQESGVAQKEAGDGADGIAEHHTKQVLDPRDDPYYSTPRLQSGSLSPTKTKKRSVVKRLWSCEEKQAVEAHMSKFIKLRKVPGKVECSECLQKAGDKLARRTWRDVKNYVHNRTYQRKRPQLSKEKLEDIIG